MGMPEPVVQKVLHEGANAVREAVPAARREAERLAQLGREALENTGQDINEIASKRKPVRLLKRIFSPLLKLVNWLRNLPIIRGIPLIGKKAEKAAAETGQEVAADVASTAKDTIAQAAPQAKAAGERIAKPAQEAFDELVGLKAAMKGDFKQEEAESLILYGRQLGKTDEELAKILGAKQAKKMGLKAAKPA